jgi:hypothetical protein
MDQRDASGPLGHDAMQAGGKAIGLPAGCQIEVDGGKGRRMQDTLDPAESVREDGGERRRLDGELGRSVNRNRRRLESGSWNNR